MPELTADDVEQYTKGRLAADNPETIRLLDAALKALRRYCGWRVTPTAEETVTLDGTGGRRLSLPTLHLVELVSLTEDGVTLDPNDLYVSPLGLVRKKSRYCWSRHYGAIEATINHGYDEATDWQAAALELIDRMSSQVGAVVGSSGPLSVKRVDDVAYQWISTIGNSPQLFDMINHTLVDPYRLEPSP